MSAFEVKDVVKQFSANQPVTFAVEVARRLTLGILIIFVPLSVWRYRKRV